MSILSRFWNTKKAVKKGDALYDWRESELQAAGLMKPIAFNVMESVLAAIPGLLLMLILFLVVSPQLIEGFSANSEAFYKELATYCVYLSIYLFIPPIFTSTLAPFAGSGSLRAEDRNPKMKRRAVRAYLYFDGALGLYTQALISLFWITMIWIGILSLETAVLFVIPFLMMGAGFRQIYLSFRVIPNRLFEINGYSKRVRHFWQKGEPNDPPWNRFSLYVIGGSIVSSFFLGLMLTGIDSLLSLVL